MFNYFIQRLKRLFGQSSDAASFSADTQQGKIKFFDRKKGFGFIIASNGKEYFFNVSATRSKDFKGLKDGALVQFDLMQGKKGLQAKRVALV